MSHQFEGLLLGKGLKFGLVISRFNEFLTKKLLEGAQDACSVEPNAVIRPAAEGPRASEVYWSLRSAAFLTLGMFALVIIIGVAILARGRRV